MGSCIFTTYAVNIQRQQTPPTVNTRKCIGVISRITNPCTFRFCLQRWASVAVTGLFLCDILFPGSETISATRPFIPVHDTVGTCWKTKRNSMLEHGDFIRLAITNDKFLQYTLLAVGESVRGMSEISNFIFNLTLFCAKYIFTRASLSKSHQLWMHNSCQV